MRLFSRFSPPSREFAAKIVQTECDPSCAPTMREITSKSEKKLAINQRVSVKYQRCFTLLPLFNRSPAKISGLVLCDVFQVLLIAEILCVAAS